MLGSVNAYQVFTESLAEHRRATVLTPFPPIGLTLVICFHPGTATQRGLDHYPKLSACFRS